MLEAEVFQPYPKSSNVYDCLAEAYKVTGNRKKAKECDKKAIDLNPGNNHAKQKLGELE